jgi:NADPH-dependent ferric siderophore reductase
MAAERPFPLHTGVARVTAIDQLTPAMRRFVLHHPAFADPGIEQPGEIVTLGWPLDGEPLVLPQLGWRFPGGRTDQHWRNYTVRAFDPASATIAVDFFLHVGPGRAAAWAERARVGDPVGFAGPRTHWVPEPDARWTLLVADETGLPALLAILETLAHRCIAVAEVAGPEEHQPAACAAELELHWVPRGGLRRAVRELELPDEPGQAWGGGEARRMRDVRRHLQAHRPDLAMRLLGYWKR